MHQKIPKIAIFRPKSIFCNFLLFALKMDRIFLHFAKNEKRKKSATLAVIQNFRKLHRVLPVEFGNFHSVLSYPTLCWQKFRISNCFTKELRSYERVDFTKNKFAEIEFLVFPYCKRNLLWQKFRESNIFTKEITK